MQYEFLKKFPRRMKNVGLYAVIIQNSSQKLSWKQYGFTKFDEQINLLFEVLLYIMEQSLKEEKCTMDDIATLKSVYLIATRDLSNLWLQFFLSQNQGFMRLFEKTVLK